MPPRHGKSNFISEWFPVWYLGTYPDHRVLLASYEADFAAEWGAKVRDHLTEHGHHFDIQVSELSHARHRFDIVAHKGGMRCAGVGGPITGKGANLLIIDDPIKNDKEARSETHREHQWDWLLSTARTRLEPGGVMVIVMTPWHQDDLSGRIRAGKLKGHPWVHVNFPAIAVNDEPEIGRKEGEPLWAERFDANALEEQRQGMLQEGKGAFWWSALYQCDPQPDEGTVILRKYLRYYEVEYGAIAVSRLVIPRVRRIDR